jgi:nitroreductase
LHYHKIAAVSLNWSKHFVLDKKMERLIKLPPSEKIISIIAAGYPPEEFKVPKSTRKDVKEILEIIE